MCACVYVCVRACVRLIALWQVRVRCPAEPELANFALQGQTLSHTMAPTMTIQVCAARCRALGFAGAACDISKDVFGSLYTLTRLQQDVKVFIQGATQLPANKQVRCSFAFCRVTVELRPSIAALDFCRCHRLPSPPALLHLTPSPPQSPISHTKPEPEFFP